MTEYKICNKCGSRVNIDYNFCPNCKSQSFRSQPAKPVHGEPSRLKQVLFYWNYDGNYVLSKSKVGGILVFLLFFLSGIFSPIAAGMFLLALIFGAITFLVGMVAHFIRGKPSKATLEYNNYGFLTDMYHLFFFWQNKQTGEFVPSKTKIFSTIVFVVFSLICALTYSSATFIVIILVGLFFELPAFLVGCGIHRMINPNPVNPPKQVKSQDTKKVREVKRFRILDRKKPKQSEAPSRFSAYETQINDLKDEFESKDKAVRKLIEKRFQPPQITYTRFISLVDKSSEVFNKEAEAGLNIISLASEDSPRIEHEITSKIDILKSIISKIDDLTNELVLSMDSSKDEDVDTLIDDMENLIGSVRDYSE